MTKQKIDELVDALMAISIPYNDDEWLDEVIYALDLEGDVIFEDNKVENPDGPQIFENRSDAPMFTMILDNEGFIEGVHVYIRNKDGGIAGVYFY